MEGSEGTKEKEREPEPEDNVEERKEEGTQGSEGIKGRERKPKENLNREGEVRKPEDETRKEEEEEVEEIYHDAKEKAEKGDKEPNHADIGGYRNWSPAEMIKNAAISLTNQRIIASVVAPRCNEGLECYERRTPGSLVEIWMVKRTKEELYRRYKEYMRTFRYTV